MSILPITVIVPALKQIGSYQQTIESLQLQVGFSDMDIILVLPEDAENESRTLSSASHLQTVLCRPVKETTEHDFYFSLVSSLQNEYLSILFPGDLLFRNNKIVEQISFLEANQSLNACCSEFAIYNPTSGYFSNHHCFDTGRFQLFDSVDFVSRPIFMNWSAMCFRTKSFADALRRLDTSKPFDWSMCALLADQRRFAYIPNLSTLCLEHKNREEEKIIQINDLVSRGVLSSLAVYLETFAVSAAV